MNADDNIILHAIAASSQDELHVTDVVAAITSYCNAEDIPSADRPLESRRERALTRLRKEGMLSYSAGKWSITDAGRDEVAEQTDALDAFMAGQH